VLLGHQITTVFQPIVDLQTGRVHGFEALSRGPAGTQQHSPINLFEAAAATDLVFELDRHCRRRALRTARDLPPPHRLFINVVPASMYDRTSGRASSASSRGWACRPGASLSR
jgi:EAL domain-containing protein (putative c-di-GMP-specific phosphodiesterase class I)